MRCQSFCFLLPLVARKQTTCSEVVGAHLNYCSSILIILNWKFVRCGKKREKKKVVKFCFRGADQGWMAHLADLHMKRVQQRRKSAAKTVKWGMEKAAESQKVHTTWSQHACFGSCEESSAALVFNCVPHKKCQSQVLQTLKCERNYSAFVFGVKIHTQREAKNAPPKTSWVLWWHPVQT